MAADTHNLVVYMGKLKIAGGATRLPGLETGGPKSSQLDLVVAINALMESSRATATHARKIFLSMDDWKAVPTLTGQEVGQISSVRRQARELKQMAESLTDESEAYIKAYIMSLSVRGTIEEKMLSHFGNDLSDIIRHILDSSCNDFDVLREVLETCYNETFNGRLNPDKYSVPLSEACLKSPYDPDFESEVFYNRHNTDEGYSEPYRIRNPRDSEIMRKEGEKTAQQWTRFWVEALNKCHGGPTLFYPPTSRHPQCQLTKVPKYLFRAFDNESSGTLDENIVASMESKYPLAGSWRDRIDLLSLQDEEAALMLFKHLSYIDFEVEESDNLVSWSSSLLFVIQCAIWRCYARSPRQGQWQTPYDVKICAVDTTKFPRGQFAHSRSLLQTYRAISRRDKEMESFFNFRLDNNAYDNGEYLSQGTLRHTGRSCIVSLSQLIQAGLYSLYPEFDDVAARKGWSKRVRELRSDFWCSEHTTRQVEMQQALNIARKCFKSFEAHDMALVLLCLKNRKIHDSVKKELELYDYLPTEVQRYMELLHRKPSESYKIGRYNSSLYPQATQDRILDDIFEIT